MKNWKRLNAGNYEMATDLGIWQVTEDRDIAQGLPWDVTPPGERGPTDSYRLLRDAKQACEGDYRWRKSQEAGA